MVVHIPLSKHSKKYVGFVAIVDDCDKDLLDSKYSWAYAPHDKSEYAVETTGILTGKSLAKLHRVVLSRKLERELLKTELVDHIDGNGLNNTRNNLRIANHSGNAMNRRKSIKNTTGFKGVSPSGRKRNPFTATIYIGGKRKRLGNFPTKELAYKAYCEAANELHRDFANHG